MSRRELFCLCLHESANNLPRTKRCRRPCRAHDLILEELDDNTNSPMETPTQDLRTSEAWYQQIPEEHMLVIMDPDGWDRTNYDYSFHEELITKTEFVRRLSYSTIISKVSIHDFLANW